MELKIVRLNTGLSDYPCLLDIARLSARMHEMIAVLDNYFGEAKYTLVGTGTSGATIMTCCRMINQNINCVLISKKNESTHRNHIEGDLTYGGFPIVVVDDTINTGTTIKYLALSQYLVKKTKAICAYNADHEIILKMVKEEFPEIQLVIG